MEASTPFREHGLSGRGMKLFNVTVALTTAACLFVVARIYAKKAAGKRIGWDDRVVSASLVSLSFDPVHEVLLHASSSRVRLALR